MCLVTGGRVVSTGLGIKAVSNAQSDIEPSDSSFLRDSKAVCNSVYNLPFAAYQESWSDRSRRIKTWRRLDPSQEPCRIPSSTGRFPAIQGRSCPCPVVVLGKTARWWIRSSSVSARGWDSCQEPLRRASCASGLLIGTCICECCILDSELISVQKITVLVSAPESYRFPTSHMPKYGLPASWNCINGSWVISMIEAFPVNAPGHGAYCGSGP